MVDITVKTEKGSKVFLIAIDINSALFSHESDISRLSIYSELVYHLNRKFQGNSNYYFEKLNTFILELVENGTNCSTFSSRFGNIDDEEIQQNSEVDMTLNKYFPENLDEIIYVAKTSENETKQMKVSGSTTTWKIYGISVHPENGFTVAKTQPEIAVKGIEKIEKIQLQISGTSVISQNEVHKLYIIATNHMKTHLNARVSVNIKDGFLIEEEMSVNRNCLEHKRVLSDEFDVTFTPENYVLYTKFQISSMQRKPIKITAVIKSGKSREQANKEIEVLKNVNNIMKKSLSTELIDPPFTITNLITTDKSNKTFAIIYGNLLGPAVDGMEKIL